MSNGVLGKNYCYLDFEYCQSNEEVLKLTSCSFQLDESPMRQTWLYNRKDRYQKLARFFETLKTTHIFVAFAATAECRSFQALGLDPTEFKWIDLYFEHRQLKHTYNNYRYGTYFLSSGMKRFSVPPSYISSQNIGKDNWEIKNSYVAACGVHLEYYVDSVRKEEMRDLILQQKPEYTKAEQQDIMDYCDDDVTHLPALHRSMTRGLWEGLAHETAPYKIIEYQLTRGEWAASLSLMETVGFPLRVDRVKNLRRNHDLACDTIIENLNEQHYPFYVRKKKRKRELIGNYTQAYLSFEKYIDECEDINPLPSFEWADIKEEYVEMCRDKEKKIREDFVKRKTLKNWPLSEKTFKYKMDEKTLEKFDGIPAIKAFRQANKLIGQLKWFQEPKTDDDDDFFDSVGSDNVLRSFLGGYGTQTGRNAPKAKTFVLAMSAWLRCLIQPVEGETIIGIDYASQEFIIAAILSKDPEMMKAYASGDPYLYFAQKAGAVPEGVNTKACKSPALILEGLQKKYKSDFKQGIPQDILLKIEMDEPEMYAEYLIYGGYAEMRDLFKATTLGLQYGMRGASLAVKLTADTGTKVTREKADELITMHESLYEVYWEWVENEWEVYKRCGFMVLQDGWALLPDNDNSLSVKNVPSQGTGAIIMREACKLYQKRGGKIMGPLHDAIYAKCKTEEKDKWMKILSECMQEAVVMVLGDIEVRQDPSVHKWNKDWIEGKGKKYYAELKQYLEHIETEEDQLTRIKNVIYGGLGVY